MESDKLSKLVRIDLPFIELSCRKNPVHTECCLLLGDTYFEYYNKSEYDTDDNPQGIMKHYISNWRKTMMRRDIIAIDMFYNNTDETWAIGLETRCDLKMEWDFKYPKDALNVYNQLKNYFISK